MKRNIIKETLKAVHDDDLEKLLKSLELLDKMNCKELKCKYCGEVINVKNLHSIFPQSGNIHLICDKLQCQKMLFDFLREDNELK